MSRLQKLLKPNDLVTVTGHVTMCRDDCVDIYGVDEASVKKHWCVGEKVVLLTEYGKPYAIVGNITAVGPSEAHVEFCNKIATTWVENSKLATATSTDIARHEEEKAKKVKEEEEQKQREAQALKAAKIKQLNDLIDELPKEDLTGPAIKITAKMFATISS
jgi:predicted HTH transcriptional regulator